MAPGCQLIHDGFQIDPVAVVSWPDKDTSSGNQGREGYKKQRKQQPPFHRHCAPALLGVLRDRAKLEAEFHRACPCFKVLETFLPQHRKTFKKSFVLYSMIQFLRDRAWFSSAQVIQLLLQQLEVKKQPLCLTYRFICFRNTGRYWWISLPYFPSLLQYDSILSGRTAETHFIVIATYNRTVNV